MTFQFDSFTDFMQMAGHGPYVWTCYLLMTFVIIYLIMSPGVQRRRFLQNLARQQRLSEREQPSEGHKPS